MLTQARLKELLHYAPETGVMKWYVKRGRSHGRDCAGYIRPDGYWHIVVDSKPYLAHRLAWLYMTGEWPKADTDHINSDRADNRWANLRQATRTLNNANSCAREKNVTGLKGVRQPRPGGSFIAQISVGNVTRYLGSFPTAEAAHAVYVMAARKHFGEFARPT